MGTLDCETAINSGLCSMNRVPAIAPGVQVGQIVCVLNPLSPDIKMHILLTVLHTLLLELARRICLNIKTSYPW